MTKRKEDAPTPALIEDYRLIIQGVAGAVHGVGYCREEGTSYRWEPSVEVAKLKMKAGYVLRMNNPKTADRMLNQIPGAPILMLEAEKAESKMGKIYVPLEDYLNYWRRSAALVEEVAT